MGVMLPEESQELIFSAGGCRSRLSHRRREARCSVPFEGVDWVGALRLSAASVEPADRHAHVAGDLERRGRPPRAIDHRQDFEDRSRCRADGRRRGADQTESIASCSTVAPGPLTDPSRAAPAAVMSLSAPTWTAPLARSSNATGAPEAAPLSAKPRAAMSLTVADVVSIVTKPPAPSGRMTWTATSDGPIQYRWTVESRADSGLAVRPVRQVVDHEASNAWPCGVP